MTLNNFLFLQGDVNVASALVSLQETTEFMAKTVNVMIDSVKMQMAMSVGVCVHLISHNIT